MLNSFMAKRKIQLRVKGGNNQKMKSQKILEKTAISVEMLL